MKKVLAIIAIVALAGWAKAAVINVPADYSTIQDAMDASVSGDTVLVAPGTYDETLVYPFHRVTVMSSDGADATFLVAPAFDKGNPPRPSEYSDTFSVAIDAAAFIYAPAADSGSSFEGFTVTGQSGFEWFFYSSGASFFEIADNRFIDNDIYDIIRAEVTASVLVFGNLFSNSTYGNVMVSTSPNCSFINNTVDGGARGLAIYGENSTILNNIVVNIEWYAIWLPSATTEVDYNDFWANGDNGNPGASAFSAL